MDSFLLMVYMLGIVILVLIIVALSLCIYYLLRLGKNFVYVVELLTIYGKLRDFSVTFVESLDPRVVDVGKKVISLLFPGLTDRRKSS